MMEKAKESFLKAQDVVEIIASPDMQAIFSRKGITKPTIFLSKWHFVSQLTTFIGSETRQGL